MDSPWRATPLLGAWQVPRRSGPLHGPRFLGFSVIRLKSRLWVTENPDIRGNRGAVVAGNLLVSTLKHALTAFAVLVTSFGAVTIAGTAPAQAGTYANTVEAYIIKHTNRERVERNLRPVNTQTCLEGLSERWAGHLARTNSFQHRDLSTAVNNCRLNYVSENLALYPVIEGMTANRVAKKAVRMWMGSSAHRANVLSHQPRLIGVGVRRSADGRSWVVVQNFGR